MSTHTPEQRLSPVTGQGVATPHAPPTHACPEAHARPQVPQLFTSSPRLTQTEPQRTRPIVHASATMHAPLKQAWPIAQAMPQPPQLLGSPCVSTQNPPQLVRPVGHAA